MHAAEMKHYSQTPVQVFDQLIVVIFDQVERFIPQHTSTRLYSHRKRVGSLLMNLVSHRIAYCVTVMTVAGQI
jgi:hypothetical protein